MVYLPIANIEVNPFLVIGIGLIVGFLAGLFGVGGGFLMTPLLNLVVGIPMNVAVGSDLNQIVATASSGAYAHRKLGNVDVKLAGFILAGSILGTQVGVRIMEILKAKGMSDLVIKEIYVVMLGIISAMMLIDSIKAIRKGKHREEKEKGGREKIDTGLGPRLQKIKFMSVHLENADVTIPFFVPPLLGFGVGVLAAIMGVGGGFIMVPALIYILGIPTVVCVGTDLFQMVFTAAAGTIAHALHGNVDFYLVLMILTGSTIGAQLGARATKKVGGVGLRLLFGLLVFIVMLRLLVNLLKMTGHL